MRKRRSKPTAGKRGEVRWPRGTKTNPSIWESLQNAWKVDDIRKKLIYTFMMLLLFRLVGVILAPGVDYSLVQSKMSTNDLPLLDLVNMMTGKTTSRT